MIAAVTMTVPMSMPVTAGNVDPAAAVRLRWSARLRPTFRLAIGQLPVLTIIST